MGLQSISSIFLGSRKLLQLRLEDYLIQVISISVVVFIVKSLFMDNLKNKIANLKLTKEKIHNLNIYLFLGFNLTLVSILGFFWFSSSLKNIV